MTTTAAEKSNLTTMTILDAKQMLSEMGFKNVSKQAIVSAMRVTDQKFKTVLLQARYDENDRDVNMRYIGSCLCLSTKVAVEFLETHQIAYDQDTLVNVGLSDGLEIRAMMKSFVETGDVALLSEIKQRFTGKIVVGEGTVDKSAQNDATNDEGVADAGGADYSGDANVAVKPEYRSVHFYGKETALCFSASQTRGNAAHTINIDAAKIAQGATASGRRNFDWKGAIHFQFTPKELFSIISVFMNVRKAAEFKNHGAQNDKGFSIERQDGKYFMKLFSKEGGARGVPVSYEDAVNLAILTIDQVAKEHPGYKKPDILLLIKMVMA